MNTRGILSLLALGLASLAQAAVEPLHSSPLLEEILVHGRQPSMAQMREEMVRLEDLFHERYNALNTDDLFDIRCAEEARTGTRLARRYCRAVFEARALEDEGKAHLAALLYQSQGEPKSGESDRIMEWIPPAPAIVAIARKRQEFRETMLRVTTENPELVELLRQRQLLADKYEERRRERFGSTPTAQK